MKKNLKYLAKKKDREEKITMLSCYDYPTARWAEAAGVDILLVGDSLGVKVLGYDDPGQVTMDDMLHHFKAVRRAAEDSFLVADLPLSSCRSLQQALDDSNCFLDQGADAIKIEAFDLNLIAHLLDNYVEVCFDLIFPLAKKQYCRDRKDDVDILVEIIKIAMELQKDGLAVFLLTMFPEEAARAATELLSVPVIGVGSGRFTDGQVLIAAEMLGMGNAQGNGYHNKQFADFQQMGTAAMDAFVRETLAGKFPTPGNSTKLTESETEKLLQALENETSVSA